MPDMDENSEITFTSDDVEFAKIAIGDKLEEKLGPPPLPERFEIEWVTDVTDTYSPKEIKETHHITGKLILEAKDMLDAAEWAVNLVDVDFFYPGQHYSASSSAVKGGSLKIWDTTYVDLEEAWPGLVEADFERIDVVCIRWLGRTLREDGMT